MLGFFKRLAGSKRTRVSSSKTGGAWRETRGRLALVEPLEQRRLLSLSEFTGATILESPPGEIRVELRCEELTLAEQANGQYRLSSPELLSGGEGGSPELPGRVLRFALPPDVDLDSVSISILSQETHVVAGSYELTPAPFAMSGDGERIYCVFNAGAEIVDGMNMDIYGSSAVWDGDICALAGAQEMGPVKIADIVYSPAAYAPTSGEVTVADRVVIGINYELSESGTSPVTVAARWTDRAREAVINEDQMAAWYASLPASSPGTYVIITTAAIQSNSLQLSDFVAHKESLGYTVAVVTETEWASGVLPPPTGDAAAEYIRGWLQNNYQLLGIEYVLLIGNPQPSIGDVPMKKTTVGPGCDLPSDYYYADLTANWDTNDNSKFGEWGTGGDFLSPPDHEVIVGRIPVYNASYGELDFILSQTIKYQTQGGALWRKSVLLPMAILNYEDEGGDAAFVDGTCLASYIIQDVADQAPGRSYSLFEHAGVPPARLAGDAAINETNLKDAWSRVDANPDETGYGIVVWQSHGSANNALRKWRDENGMTHWESFCGWGTAQDLRGILFDHPSLVIQCSCANGAPGDPNGLAYSLLAAGAIGTISGSAPLAYRTEDWDPRPDYVGDMSTFGYEIPKRLVEGWVSKTVGDALQECRELVWDYVGWTNAVGFNLYGDPSVALGDHTRVNLAVNGTADGSADEYRLVRNGEYLDIYVNGVALSPRVILDDLKTLTIMGTADDDTLIVDLAGGDPVPLEGIEFFGASGSGNDFVVVQNDSLGRATLILTATGAGTLALERSSLEAIGTISFSPKFQAKSKHNFLRRLPFGAFGNSSY